MWNSDKKKTEYLSSTFLKVLKITTKEGQENRSRNLICMKSYKKNYKADLLS